MLIFSVLAFFNSCISVEKYARHEQNLSGCIAGVVAPADEFCANHSNKMRKAGKKIGRRLKVLSFFNPKKHKTVKAQVDSIDLHLEETINAVY